MLLSQVFHTCVRILLERRSCSIGDLASSWDCLQKDWSNDRWQLINQHWHQSQISDTLSAVADLGFASGVRDHDVCRRSTVYLSCLRQPHVPFWNTLISAVSAVIPPSSVEGDLGRNFWHGTFLNISFRIRREQRSNVALGEWWSWKRWRRSKLSGLFIKKKSLYVSCPCRMPEFIRKHV